MEDLLTYSVIKGMIIPAQAVMYILAGHFATNLLNLHKIILFFNGSKAVAVAVASFPIAVVYIATGEAWESTLVTFFAANSLYAYGIKGLLNYFKKT
jgi:hypothetical protein